MTATVLVDEVRQVLRDAAQLLEQHGWCQRQSRTGGGALDVAGAIAAAAGGAWRTERRAHHALEVWLIWHTNAASVAQWNDAPERTKAEVLAALRAAAQDVAA